MNYAHSAKIKSFSKPRVMVWPGYVLFFMMLFMPVSQNLLMGSLATIVAVMIVFDILLRGGRVALSRTILLWTLFYAALGGGFALLGFLNAAPGALFSMYIFFIAPLAFALFIEGMTSARVLNVLLRLIVIATIAIGLAGLNLVLWQNGTLPDALHLNIDLGQNLSRSGISFSDGSSRMNFYPLSSLIFTLPFLITSLIVYDKKNPPFISRFWIYLALGLGLTVAFLGGRQALLLVLILTPAISLFLRSLLPRKVKSRGRLHKCLNFFLILITILGLLVYLNNVFEWTSAGLYKSFLNSFDYRNDPSAQIRYDQFDALLNDWARHPFIGSGLGSYVPELIRSPEKPWQYELQYVLMLSQTGIIGLLLYSSGVVWLYIMGVKIMRSGSSLGVHMVPVLAGTTGILIAGATNPYFQAFGHLWMLFFPIALINIWLLSSGDLPSRNAFSLRAKNS